MLRGHSQLIQSVDHVDELEQKVRSSAERFQAWLDSVPAKGLQLLKALKFDTVGFHPLDGRSINPIEQVNQVWTCLMALSAVRKLLVDHPEAGGFTIAPGAHAFQPLDIMSQVPGHVGAETFAAVDPRNNAKLQKDLAKLAQRNERHRYVFFASPRFQGHRRLTALERDGVQVWSVDV